MTIRLFFWGGHSQMSMKTSIWISGYMDIWADGYNMISHDIRILQYHQRVWEDYLIISKTLQGCNVSDPFRAHKCRTWTVPNGSTKRTDPWISVGCTNILGIQNGRFNLQWWCNYYFLDNPEYPECPPPPKKKNVFFFGLLLFGAISFTSRNNPRTSNPGEGARLRQLQWTASTAFNVKLVNNFSLLSCIL